MVKQSIKIFELIVLMFYNGYGFAKARIRSTKL